MKYSKREIMSRVYKIPELKFEDQNLTSFAGLVIFQPLMLGLELKNRLFHCFQHLNVSQIFGHHVVTVSRRLVSLSPPVRFPSAPEW